MNDTIRRKKLYRAGRKQNRIKGDSSFRIAKSVACILFFAYAASILLPFVWMILSTLKGSMEFQLDKFALPKEWLFSNYKEAWNTLSDETTDTSLLSMLINSIWWSVGGGFLTTATSTMLAYAIAKFKFRGRTIIYATALFTMLLPIYGSMPANMVLINDLGLYDSPLILITCCAGFGGDFIMIYAIFKSVSWNYAEAAYIDGAGHFTVFFKIMLPLAITPVLALFIMSVMSRWNDYMTSILYFPSYLTIPAGLYSYKITHVRDANMPVLFAGLLMCMIPPLILFIALQNKLSSLTISGGLKG